MYIGYPTTYSRNTSEGSSSVNEDLVAVISQNMRLLKPSLKGRRALPFRESGVGEEVGSLRTLERGNCEGTAVTAKFWEKQGK